jgi:hypothetical protein
MTGVLMNRGNLETDIKRRRCEETPEKDGYL